MHTPSSPARTLPAPCESNAAPEPSTTGTRIISALSGAAFWIRDVAVAFVMFGLVLIYLPWIYRDAKAERDCGPEADRDGTV